MQQLPTASQLGASQASSTVWRVVWAVLTLAVVVRICALVSLSLIITNDGVGYLQAATGLWDGQGLVMDGVRTPVYPMFLTGVFQCFGVSAQAVLLAQHGLGCLICVLMTLIGCRVAGPKWGWIPGILIALDPWLLMFESYALTESLAVFLVVSAATIAVCCTRPRIRTAVLLGLVLAAGCLTRPALQAMVPFFALGWLAGCCRTWRMRLVGLIGLSVGFSAAMGPWLYYNSQRGVNEVASGLPALQWGSLALYGVVDWSFPEAHELRKVYETRYNGRRPTGYELLDYLHDADAFTTQAALFRRWNRASLINNFDKYIRVWPQALGWQLNYPNGRETYDQLNWYIGRLGRDGTGFQFQGDCVSEFASTGRGGPLRAFMKWWQTNRLPGIPQVPLFVLTLVTIALALIRREWAIAFVLIGTVMFLLAHVSLLKSPARYALPAWTMWYVAVVAAPALLLRRAHPPVTNTT